MLNAMVQVSPTAPNPAASNDVRRIDSGALLDGGQEVRIVHKDQEYRLRQTRNGKLILTK